MLTKRCDPKDLALSIKHNSYFSHAIAASIHGLIKKLSRTLYVSVEGKPRKAIGQIINQALIDEAFEGPQRKSSKCYNCSGHTVLLLTSLFSEGRGINRNLSYPVTTIERTLLDCTVRPAYDGGAQTVLELYRKAIAKGMDAKLLINLYDELSFVYPYHQAIGFYLEKAGGDHSVINELYQKPRPFYFLSGLQNVPNNI